MLDQWKKFLVDFLFMKMMLPGVIGHENQSQHCPDHRCLCLVLSGRITTPDGFLYYTGFTTRRTRRPPRAASFWGGNKSLVKIFLGLNIAPFSNLGMNGLNKERNSK